MLDCGRYPVKRTLGDRVEVWADVFGDGHDVLRAVVRHRPPGSRRWGEAPLEPIGNDRWHGGVRGRPSSAAGSTRSWPGSTAGASWRWELKRKVDGRPEDLSSELLEGAALARGRRG